MPRATAFSTVKEPWPEQALSAEAALATGRGFVILPTANDPRARARVLETAHGLVRIGSTGEGDDELWELPVVWLPTTKSAVPHIEIELLSEGRRETCTLPVLSPPEPPQQIDGESSDDPDKTSALATDTFDEVLDHHVEATRHWLDGGEEDHADLIGHASGLSLLPLHEFCERYWELEDKVEAPLTLIVRIATEVGSLVESVAESPRKILRRDRRMVPLGRAQQIDPSCLRWLTRQPGRTMAQRAGPRQMVMAVVRDPSIDTLENRVLRHFLELCRAAASRYLSNNRSHSGSPRLTAVQRFRAQVDRLLRQAPIGQVGRLTRIPEPNYVLQFDDRYSVIWTWYVRLIRQEQERDDLRAWHQRVWAERCLTAVLATLERQCVRLTSFRGQLALRHEASEGCFFAAASSLGPWTFRRTPMHHVVRILHRKDVLRNAQLAPLAKLAFDFVLVRQSPFDEQDISAALAVFTLFTPADTDSGIGERLERLDNQLALVAPGMRSGALVLTPHTTDTQALQQSQTKNVVSCRLPMPTSQDKSPGWKALGRCLTAFVEQTTQ